MSLYLFFLNIFLLIKFHKILSLTVYFEYHITNVDDKIIDIESSEGKFYPITEGHHAPGDNFIFIIPKIKHNLLKPLCIHNKELTPPNYFSFLKVTLNEYDITFLPVEKFYFCNDCQMNTSNKFQTYINEIPVIILAYTEGPSNFTYSFCLYGNNNISNFNTGRDNINQNYYKGKNKKYFLNKDNYNFNIDDIFDINENPDFIFDLDCVSLKIYNISNINGKILNENEELYINSVFNAKNTFLTHIKTNNNGYLMIIEIETRTRLINSISYSTCSQKSHLYLYVAQDNCTMFEESDNFCQKCENNYGKLGNKCYYKTENFSNLYYEESKQIWKECESDKQIYKCSICSKGTYINSLNYCQKCPEGYYNDIENARECKKCPKGFYSDISGSIICQKCPEGFTSLLNSSECFKICESGFYPIGNECLPCEPGFYSEASSLNCSSCIPGTFTNNEGMNKCIECFPGTFNNDYNQISCQQCPPNYYSDFPGSIICKKCEDNNYSLYGFSKCLSCNILIPFCNKCSINGICLKCNNYALSGYNNCSICENDYDYIFNGEYCKLITKCPVYFYKNKANYNKMVCIEECPDDKIYLNLETKECEENATSQQLITGNYQINGDIFKLNEISDNILKETKEFPEFFEDFFLKNKVRLKGKNVTVKMGTDKILKNQNQNESDVELDFGECLEILRINYSIKENENTFLYKTLELKINGTRVVNYNIYDVNDVSNPLDLSSCKNKKITYVIPFNPLDYFENNEEIEYWLSLIKDGNNIFDSYSSIYNDICFPLTLLNKYDLTLRERRELILRKNLPLCEKGCEYEGEKIEIFQIQCYCKIKLNISNNNILSQFGEGFKDLKYKNNFPVLACYKLLFSINGLKNNFGSYLFIFFFILEIILIIITEIYIKRGYLDDLIKNCELFIVDIEENNSIFKALREVYLGRKNIKEEMYYYIRKFYFEKDEILNSPPRKRNIKNYKKNIKIKKIRGRSIKNEKKQIDEANKNNINNKDITIKQNIETNQTYKRSQITETQKNFSLENSTIRKGKLVLKDIKNINNINNLDIIKNNEEFKEYYLNLIFSYNIKHSNGRIMEYLIDDELNGLEYIYYRKIEQRKFGQIYWSLFKSKYDFINTFFKCKSSKDYRIYPIKIMIYLNSIIISIIINLIFYNDDTMHKIYLDEGEYNIVYSLFRIISTDVIERLTTFLIEQLIDYQNKFIELKTNMKETKIEKEIKKINKDENVNEKEIKEINIDENDNEKDKLKKQIGSNLRISWIIFYFISIFISLISWYYISCFCAVYKKTQKYLLFDFLVGRFLNLVSCLISCLINLLIN